MQSVTVSIGFLSSSKLAASATVVSSGNSSRRARLSFLIWDALSPDVATSFDANSSARDALRRRSLRSLPLGCASCVSEWSGKHLPKEALGAHAAFVAELGKI